MLSCHVHPHHQKSSFVPHPSLSLSLSFIRQTILSSCPIAHSRCNVCSYQSYFCCHFFIISQETQTSKQSVIQSNVPCDSFAKKEATTFLSHPQSFFCWNHWLLTHVFINIILRESSLGTTHHQTLNCKWFHYLRSPVNVYSFR
jgi:hypothetical protein